jgi:hypothetical protein
MGLKPSSGVDGRNFSEFQKIAAEYGAKAAGLCLLPRFWTPDFVVLSKELSPASIANMSLFDPAG